MTHSEDGKTQSSQRLEKNKQDIDAVKQTLSGNRRAFEPIVNRYTPLLYSLAYQMLGEEFDVEEAVQEIFLKLYKVLPRFDLSRRFHPWMYTIAVNTLRSVQRKKRRKMFWQPAEFDETQPANAAQIQSENPIDRVINREGEHIARKALSRLRREYREVFILRRIEGIPEKEVAEILGILQGTVKTYSYRARRELAAILAEAGWEK